MSAVVDKRVQLSVFVVAAAFATGCPEDTACENSFQCDVGQVCVESACVEESAPPRPTIVRFTSSDVSILAGDAVDLSWEVVDADSCSLDALTVACSATVQVQPTTSTVFQLSAFSEGGTASAFVEVEVEVVSTDGGVEIDGGTIELDSGPTDAGVVVVDAGPIVVDGGPLDAGVDGGGIIDSGVDAGPTISPLRVHSIETNGTHTCAIFTPRGVDDNVRSVKCWGDNEYGQLGLGDTNYRGDNAGEMGPNLPLVLLGGTPISISAGYPNTCAVVDVSGTSGIKCWGDDSRGQLGLGSDFNRGSLPDQMGIFLPFVNLGEEPRDVVSGSYATCAISVSNRLKCWGGNLYGGLGLGDTLDRGGPSSPANTLPFLDTPPIEIVTVGNGHVCVMTESASIYCWGQNGDGRLGIGGTENIGDEPAEMGENLVAVDLGGIPLDIQTGGQFTCALLLGGIVKCWGANFAGSLGLGDVDNRGDEPDEMGVNLPAVDLDGQATAIAVGFNHSCAVLENGEVKCWGGNFEGELGRGDLENIGDEPGEMGAALEPIQLPGPARLITAGYYYTCVVVSGPADDVVLCWGGNYFGQLGLGDVEARGDAPGELGAALPDVLLE